MTENRLQETASDAWRVIQAERGSMNRTQRQIVDKLAEHYLADIGGYAIDAPISYKHEDMGERYNQLYREICDKLARLEQHDLIDAIIEMCNEAEAVAFKKGFECAVTEIDKAEQSEAPAAACTVGGYQACTATEGDADFQRIIERAYYAHGGACALANIIGGLEYSERDKYNESYLHELACLVRASIEDVANALSAHE